MTNLVKINGKLLCGRWNKVSFPDKAPSFVSFVTKRTNLLKTPLLGLCYKLYVSKTLEGFWTTHILLEVFGLFQVFREHLGHLSQHSVLLKMQGRNGHWKVVQDTSATFMSQQKPQYLSLL